MLIVTNIYGYQIHFPDQTVTPDQEGMTSLHGQDTSLAKHYDNYPTWTLQYNIIKTDYIINCLHATLPLSPSPDFQPHREREMISPYLSPGL